MQWNITLSFIGDRLSNDLSYNIKLHIISICSLWYIILIDESIKKLIPKKHLLSEADVKCYITNAVNHINIL